MVDRMLRHVKDLRPIVGPGQPTVCSDMVSEDASKRFVTIRERPCQQAPSTNAGDASFNNTSDEDQVTILPRRSTRRKRPIQLSSIFSVSSRGRDAKQSGLREKEIDQFSSAVGTQQDITKINKACCQEKLWGTQSLSKEMKETKTQRDCLFGR